MGNKCCKCRSSTYGSTAGTVRSFSSCNSSAVRSTGSHAITFGTSTRRESSLTTLAMKSSIADESDVDYRGGSSSTIGQEDPMPIFLRRLNDLNVRVGTRTRLLIELDDATGVQVRWYHNNMEADSDRYQCIHEGGFYCLDIVPVTLDDEGLWVCTAQNYAGKSSTASRLSLIVPKAFKKPTFVEPLRAALTQRGVVSLECKVVGVPTPKLRWFKDDKEIKAGDIFALTATAGDDCLGVYACEATNVMGSVVSTSKIRVARTAQPDADRWNADSLIPYGPAPKFVKNLKDMSGKVGNVLFLECQVEVPPWPQSVGWYNDNGIVNEGPLYHLLSDGLGLYGVEIQALRADHSTTWKCVVTSSTGVKAITSCLVTVSCPKNYRVPRFLESLRAIMTDEGLVSFECKVIGYPTPELSWFKDGNQLQPGDVYELTGSKSLGTYCCVARNCMGEASSIAELTVEDIQSQLNESEKLQLTSNTQPPRFLLGLKSTEANINEPFVFTVKVVPEPRPSISWYKEDEELTDSDRYQLSSDGNGTFVLNIVPLEVDDQAEWKCVAVNKYGQTVTSSFLKLNVPKNFKPPRFLDELRIAFSNEGSVNLECKVIGVPQPQLKWFKDGQELNPGDMHKIISGQSGTCCLGTYTCQAHNCMGTVSSSATLLTMEDKSTVKSGAPDEYLSVGNPLVRNESLSTIPEERTSQMEKSYTIEEPADVSFSFDGKEVTVSLYETPDLTHDEALQIIEMYADELSEHISEDNVIDLPSLRIVKESSISGPVMMEALVIDVPVGFCQQKTVSDTEFDGVSLTEDTTIENNDDNSDSLCEHSFDYFSDHLSSSNSKKDVFFSASETTPKHSSLILKLKSEDDGGHTSFNTPKLFMSNSDDQVLTQLNLNERQQYVPHTSRNVIVRSESNNDTEEEVSESLAEIENEPPLPHNYCAAEILTQSDEDGLYSTVLNKVRNKEMTLSSEEDDILKIISRPNVDEFLKYMKIILEGTMVKMHTHENFIYSDTPTELERSIQALHSLAWKFIEETERDNITELDKNTTNNVSSLMTAINASLLALEQIDDPFGVSDNILNEIQSSICFDLETLNNKDLPATEILDRLSNQIKNFTVVVNRHVARVTEQRIIAVLRNTISTTLLYIKTLQQNCTKIKNININSLGSLFSMIQPLDIILEDISLNEEASVDNIKPNLKLKQMLIPPISSIAFSLDNLNKELKNEYSEDDPDLKDIYDRINDSANQFMVLASQGTEGNNLAECFISFTKPINDLCCYLRRIGRSSENIVSSDYGSDDKLLLDFETVFDELMMDIDTLINNVNVVRDSDNNINPLGSLLEPLQDIKIGLFQVNQVLLSNQTGSNMSFEVISCFEHLSHQFVQLNNCITNQSIIEETNKEMPFESSIKMMQNILFNDAIDDLGVNGILFGSVMKPLLQLQNLIVSKMASVESDLSFSEHTDPTGGASQSLSLSLSNNAQTVFDKVSNDNLKQETVELAIINKKTEEIDKDTDLLYIGTSKTTGDFTPFKDVARNNLAIKRGFECDIGEAFRDEEPNIIMSEDDRENSGFEVLFDETDLETASDFVEDDYSDNFIHPKADNSLDSNINEIYGDFANNKNYDNISECVQEAHIEQNFKQDPMLSSPSDLLDELQETLKNISEITQDTTKEIYSLDDITSKVIQLPQTMDRLDNEITKPFIEPLEVDTINSLTLQTSNNLTMKDQFGVSEENSEISKNVDTVSEINQKVDSIDSNKSDMSKDTVIKINEIPKEDFISEKVNTVNKNECLKMKNKDESLDLVQLLNYLVETVDSSNDIDINDVSHETKTNQNLKGEDNSINIEIGNSDKILSQSDIILIEDVDNLPIASNETRELNEQYKIINEENNFTKITEIETQKLQISPENQVQAEINEQQVLKDEYELEPNTTKVIIVEHKNGFENETDLITEEIEVPLNENIIIKTKSHDDNDLQPTVIDTIEEIVKDSEQTKSSQEIDFKTVVESEPLYETNEERHDLNASNKSSEENKQNEVKLNINRNNTENLFNDDLQEKENITSVTLSTQTNLLNSSLASDTDQGIKTKLNTSQTESQVSHMLDQLIDKKNVFNDINGITNTKLLTNIDKNIEIIQQTSGKNVDSTSLTNTEVTTVEELNEQYKNLFNIHENSIDEKTNINKLISIEVVDNKNVDEERVLDIPTIIENISTTKSNSIEPNECESQDNKVSTSIIDLEVLDEQVEQQSNNVNQIISKNNKSVNAEDNENKVIHLKSDENTTLNQDTSIKEHVQNELENTKVNELKITSESILSKEETDSNDKINEDSKTEPTVKVDKDECENKISKSVEELKKAIIEDNSETNENAYEFVPTIQSETMKKVKTPLILNEESNALVNNEVVTAESTQPIDQYKFDENQGEMNYEDTHRNNAIYEEVIVLENVDSNKNDSEYPEIKEDLKYLSAEITDIDEDQSLFEIDNINEDSVTLINDSSIILDELHTSLTVNNIILIDNVQLLEKSDLNLKNAQEKQEEELKHALQSQKINVCNAEEKVDEKNTVDIDTQTVLNEPLIQNQLDSNDLTHDEKSSHLLKQNIETNTPKSNDEEPNLSTCVIVNDCKNTGEINAIFSESLKENAISKLELSNECGINVLEDSSDKILTELETTQLIATKERCIGEIQFFENNNLSNENEQLKDLSFVENDLKERKCSFLIEENTALKNMEIITADSTQIINHPTICSENVKENYVDQNKQIAECQDVVILENVDGLNLNLPQSKDVVFNVKELNSNEDNFSEISVIDRNEIKIDEQQTQVLTEECKAIVNEEVMAIDNIKLLKPCDMKMENEKSTNNLVDGIEITETDVLKSITSIDEAIEKPKNGKINTDEVKDNFTGSLNTQEADVISVHANECKDDQESETDEKLNDNTNCLRELSNQNECLPTNNDVDSKTTEITTFDSSIKENVQVVNDANITFQQNDTFITESQGVLGIQHSEENDWLKTEVENKPKTNKTEPETVNKMKTNQQINVFAIKKNADLQEDIILEDEIIDLSINEIISTQAVKSKSHCVEQLAANQTECIMLENTSVLKQDNQNCIQPIKEHAQVKHELNIAAIGNIVIDYDSIKESPTNEDDQIKSIENAIITTVNEHSKEIMTENVKVLKAPEECFTTQKTVVINEDSDKSLEKSMILKTDSSIAERKNPDESSSTEKSNTNNLILRVEHEEEINEKLQQSNEINQLDEPLETSTASSDPLENTIIFNNKINISDASNKEKNIEKIDTKLKSEIIEENSTINVLKNENDKLNADENKNQSNTHIDAQETKDDQENVSKKCGSKKKKSNQQSLEKTSPSPDKPTENNKTYENIINANDNIKLDITNSENEVTQGVKNKLEEANDEQNIKQNINKTNIENVELDKSKIDTFEREKVIINKNKNESKIDKSSEENDKKKRGSKEKTSSPQPQTKNSPSPEKSTERTDKNLKINEQLEEKTKINTGIEEDKITFKTKISDKVDNKLQAKVDDETCQNQLEISNSEQNVKEADEIKEETKKKETSQVEILSSPDKPIEVNDKDYKNDQQIVKEINSNVDIVDNSVISKTELPSEIENKLQSEVEDEHNFKQNTVIKKIENVEPDLDKNKINTSEQDETEINDNKETNQMNSAIDKDIEKTDKNKRGSKKKKTSPQPQSERSPTPDKSTKITCKDTKINQPTKEKIKIETNIAENKTLSNTESLDNVEDKLHDELKDEKRTKTSKLCDENKNIEEPGNNKRGSKKKKTSLQPQTQKSPSPEKSTEITQKDDKIDQQTEEKSKIKTTDLVKDEIVSKTDLPTEFENKLQNVVKDEKGESKTKISDKNKCIEEPDNSKRGSKKKKTSVQPQTKKSPSPEKSTERSKNDKKIEEKTKPEIDVIEDKTSSKTDLSSKFENELQGETKDEQNERKSEMSDQDKCIEEPDNSKRGSKKKKTSVQPQTKKSPSPEKSTEITKNNKKIEEKTKPEIDVIEDKTASKTDLASKFKNELQSETKDEQKEKKSEISDRDKCIEELGNDKRGSKKKKTSSAQPQIEKSPSPEKLTEISDNNDKIDQQMEEKAKTLTNVAIEEKTDLSKKFHKDEFKDELRENKSEISDKEKNIEERGNSKRGSKKKKTKKSPSPEKSTEITEKNVNQQTGEREKTKITDAVEDETVSKSELKSKFENELQKGDTKNELGENKPEIADKGKCIEEPGNRKRGSSKKKKTSRHGEKSQSPDKSTEITEKGADKVDRQMGEESKTKSDVVEDKIDLSIKFENGEAANDDERNESKPQVSDKDTRIEESGNDSKWRSKKNKTRSASGKSSSTETIRQDDRAGDEETTADVKKRKAESATKRAAGEMVSRSGVDGERNTIDAESEDECEISGNVRESEIFADRRAANDRGKRSSKKTNGRRTAGETNEDIANGETTVKIIDCGRRDVNDQRTSERPRWDGSTEPSGGSEPRDRERRSRADVCCTVVTDVDGNETTDGDVSSWSPPAAAVLGGRGTARCLDVTDAWPERLYRRSPTPDRRYCRSSTPERRWHSFSAGRETATSPFRRSTTSPFRHRTSTSPFRHRSTTSPFRHRSTTSPCRRTLTAGRSAVPYRWSSIDWRPTETVLNRTERPFATLHFCVRLTDRTAASGTGVKFWCTVIGYPEPRVQWYREGQRLDGGLSAYGHSAGGRYRTRYTDGLAQLYVDDVRSCDSGQYTCVASNGRDRISTTGFLTVYTSPSAFGARTPPSSAAPVDHHTLSSAWHGRALQSDVDLFRWPSSRHGPRFLTGMIADDVATYGGTIALQVRVQGYPAPYVTWSRDSRPLPRLSGKYIYLNDAGGLHTLLVNDSTARDGGTYVCRACNLYGSADAAKTIRVVSAVECVGRRTGVKPAIIVSRPADRLNVAVGEDIVVTLRVAGEPKPKVIWMRGSRDVTFHDRSLKETVNDYVKLSIKKAQPSDAGTYFIIAKNVYGSDRAFVTVGVSDDRSSVMVSSRW